MRLIRCHIENFGKLQNLTVDFEKGYQVFCYENGWGKSTFAAFIRVMLYGFEGESKRKGIENERKRYMPWQGGVYGGQLEFEVDGRKYVVSRTFGDKKMNDVFVLRDAVTNLESADYSENLGEELFYINSESFMKTVFIGQNDCITGATDSINAKISNLTDNMNDLDCYEKATAQLQDLLNKWSKKRKTGKIYQERELVMHMQTEIMEGRALIGAIEKYEGMMKDLGERLATKQEQLQQVHGMQSQVSLFKDIKAQQAVYKQMWQTLAEAKKLYRQRKEYFPKEIPTDEQLREAMDAYTQMEQARHATEIYSFGDEENKQLDELARGMNGRQRMRERMENSVQEAARLLNLWEQRKSAQAAALSREDTIEDLRESLAEDRMRDKKPGAGPLVLGIILLVLGVLLAASTFMEIPYVSQYLDIAYKMIPVEIPMGFLFPGVILLIIGIILIIVNAKFRREYAYREEMEGENPAIMKLMREIERDREFVANADKEIEAFLKEHDKQYIAPQGGDTLKTMIVQFDRNIQDSKHQEEIFLRLSDKYENYQQACKRYFGNRDLVITAIKDMGFYPDEELRDQLQEIWKNRVEYVDAEAAYRTADKAVKKFESEHDMKTLLREVNEEELPSMESLNQLQIQLDLDIAELQKQMNAYKHQVNALNEKYDEREELQKQLELQKESLRKHEKTYKYLQKAQDYLGQAKEALTARYMKPLLASFSKYYKLIVAYAGKDVISADQYRLDANTNITVEEQGMQREAQYLSTGYQDLIGICMRLSLVDAMYQGEKPFLILDDPFVNLDNEKARGARALMDEIAKQYQVIYFTCRKERV